MELIEISIKVVDKVINEKVNFLQSLKEECKFLDKFDKNKVSSLTGMYFRNYFLIKHFLKENDINENSRFGILIGLTFINNAFKHIVDDNELLKSLFDELNGLKFINGDELKISLDNLISLKRKYEFKKIKKNSIEHASIRFNLPTWFIKLILNQYGKEDGLLVFKTLSSMPSQYLSINFEKEIEHSKDLENFNKIEEDLYLYSLDKTSKKEKLVFENVLYLTQKDIKNIFKDVEILPFSKLTFFSDSNDNVVFDFIKKFYREDSEFSFVTSNAESNYLVFDKIRKFKKRNFHIFDLSASAIRTYSIEGEDLIMYSPKCSNFDLFRRNPEYGILLDSNKLYEYITKEEKEVIELAKNVKNGGYFIYYVPTINQKETTKIKEHLLSTYKEEFELVKEELYLPLKKEDSLFYYFIVRRK